MSDQTVAPIDAAQTDAPAFTDAELAAALHAGQTDAPAFLSTLNPEQRAAIVDAHRLAELANDPICQTFAALTMMLSERANDIAASMTDTSVADAQLAALRAIPGADADGSPIRAAILQTERDRELTLASALKTAEAANRKRYQTFLDELSRIGLPDAPPPTGKSGKSNGASSAPSAITDADGHTYVKNATARANYVKSGKSGCGACPVSRDVIPQAPDTAGDDAVKLPNFRQNSTKALAKMTRADVIGHADCFAALTDAELSYPQAINVHSYLLAE